MFAGAGDVGAGPQLPPLTPPPLPSGSFHATPTPQNLDQAPECGVKFRCWLCLLKAFHLKKINKINKSFSPLRGTSVKMGAMESAL